MRKIGSELPDKDFPSVVYIIVPTMAATISVMITSKRVKPFGLCFANIFIE
jgi:hypothetical protein